MDAEMIGQRGISTRVQVVRLPAGEDLDEWFTVNVIEFYNAISMLYTTLEDFCTSENCPRMTASDKVR